MDSTAKVQVNVEDPPDLTDTLRQDLKRFVKGGAFGIVYRCQCEQNGEVAVKAISLPGSLDRVEKDEFVRKIRRELAIWKRLDHPNIVPFLGTADGQIFGSDYPCMVSVWMPNGTLADYVTRSKTIVPLPDRVRLITGSAAGLEYLHSMSIVHGDFHPGNILIDSDCIARITDFGFSQTGSPQKDLSYLWSHTVRPGAVMWVAPEIRYPDLFPDLMLNACGETKLAGDIYSFGSITLFILSGKLPWSKGELEKNTDELQNPPRPTCPVIPDVVWHFIEQCWSPRVPRNRPSAKEVLTYCTERLQRSLQPSSDTDINIVLFGTVGCGKSSIINLLSEKPVAPVSTNMEPCTTRPRHYPISIGERRFRLWDTTGFRVPSGAHIDTLSPYKQAHAVLRNLRGGVHLILLCARKDEVFSSLSGLYWLINNFFFGGRGPVALIVTHFDNPDKQWWELNERFIVARTGIPVQSIPHACTTTVSTASNQSKQTLQALLANCTHSTMPVPLRLDISSHELASLNIATQCGLSNDDAVALVEEFTRPQQPVNVVVFGEACVGTNSVIDLLAEHPVAQVKRAGIKSCTPNSTSDVINTLAREFVVWDTAGFNGIRKGYDMMRRAVLDSVELIRDLSKKSGVDLLVFVKRCGKLTESEMHCYKFFAELICEERVPVAVVITHTEDQQSAERCWEMNGDELLKSLGGNLIGHACVTFLATTEIEDPKFSAESGLAVQAILEDFIFFPRKEKTFDRLSTNGGREAAHMAKMTIENLVNVCGLGKDLAEEAIWLYNSEERAKSLYARNIVVYGETGTGKSSIINLIAGRELIHVSNDVPGCTLRHQRYIVELNEVPYAFWEITIPDKENKGTVPAALFESLKSLIQGLANTGGVCLVVYCIHGTRLMKALQRNYDLFYVTICRKKAPVALVVSGLEHRQGEMKAWWDDNEPALRRHGMQFDAHACVTTLDIPDEVIQQRRLHSQRLLRELVFRHSQLPAWRADPSFILSVLPTLRTALRKTVAASKTKKSTTIRRVITFDMVSASEASDPRPIKLSRDAHLWVTRTESLSIEGESYQFISVDKRALQIQVQKAKPLDVDSGAGVLVFYTSPLGNAVIAPEEVKMLEEFHDIAGGQTCPMIVVLRKCNNEERVTRECRNLFALHRKNIQAHFIALSSQQLIDMIDTVDGEIRPMAAVIWGHNNEQDTQACWADISPRYGDIQANLTPLPSTTDADSDAQVKLVEMIERLCIGRVESKVSFPKKKYTVGKRIFAGIFKRSPR